jgi:hypothetical protein
MTQGKTKDRNLLLWVSSMSKRELCVNMLLNTACCMMKKSSFIHYSQGGLNVFSCGIKKEHFLPVRGARMKIGTWQQVVAINHDNHPRTWTVEVTIFGMN